MNAEKDDVNHEREIIHDVALSFAGEQRHYVNEVADICKKKGIDVFYDEFYDNKMWGHDLAEYLLDVYYKKSRYCMMFISQEYISKSWPTHERIGAVARQIQELGDYILPVRFDDVEVPGLNPDLKYMRANVNWPRVKPKPHYKNPDELVEAFIDKLEP